MNIAFKPFMLGIYLSVALGICASSIFGVFLKESYVAIEEYAVQQNSKAIDVVSRLGIQAHEKKQVKQKTTKIAKKSGAYLLKEFSISGISYDGKESMVIARDKKSGKFLYRGDSFKGYTLQEVYVANAVFAKNGNKYYAFLSPKDEKSFKEVAAVAGGTKTIIQREKVTGSVAKSMFEDIKYKNGTYYIPQDTLLEYSDLKKIFRSIGIQGYNTNGAITYKVVRVQRGSVFSKIGLRRGDFITAINNQQFKSMMEPIKYFNNLQNIKSLNITIKRNQKMKELKYEIF